MKLTSKSKKPESKHKRTTSSKQASQLLQNMLKKKTEKMSHCKMEKYKNVFGNTTQFNTVKLEQETKMEDLPPLSMSDDDDYFLP